MASEFLPLSAMLENLKGQSGEGDSQFAPLSSLLSPPLANSDASPGVGPARKCEPQINLVREGDRISSIRVTCSCGEVVEIQCEY